MAKNVQIGSVIVTTGKDGRKRSCIGLGSKSGKPQYDYSVELVVRDGNGKVVAQQRDGFVNLIDPRTQPDELFKAGIIDEPQYEKMKQNVGSIPEKIKFKLQVPSS